jgi:hypothetical protein
MSFNIKEFSAATQDGLLREAHFELFVSLPRTIQGNIRQLSVLCSSATLPERQAEVVEIRRQGSGLQSPYVTGLKFTPLNVSFYCDAKANTIRLFQQWLDSMMSYKGASQNLNLVQYKSEYKSTLNLLQYDSQGEQVAQYDFFTAYPVSVGPINFSWASRNSLVLVPVTFMYTYYEMKPPAGSVSSTSIDRELITLGPTRSPTL